MNPILKTARLTDSKQWTMPQRDAEINCILISRGLQDKIDGKIIEFFIFHELRHLHQHYEIALLDSNNVVHEDISTIVSWKNGFINYTRNEGGSTQAVNLSQEVEIDANAYALCLSNMLHISDNIELRFSVPQEAMDLADPRSRQYYENRPELKRYIDKLKRDAGQPVVRKPERNELCPCGSGKKFKKCCIGKGIYD